MVDRLADLGDIEPLLEPETGDPELEKHMELYKPIKHDLNAIVYNVKVIEKLKDKDKITAKEKDRKELMHKLEDLMSETTKKGRVIKAQLAQIKAQNIDFKKTNGESAKTQAMDNLYSSNIRRFHAVMNDYNTASYDFKQGLQERTRRQIKIIDTSISDEEVERIVSSGTAQDLIEGAIISQNMTDTLKDIEERHADIIKLERQVLEVYELFKDLAVLVDIQQEHLDVIENRVTSAKAYVDKGETELIEGEKSQIKARRKKFCLIVTFLIILVVMMSSIIASVMDDA